MGATFTLRDYASYGTVFYAHANVFWVFTMFSLFIKYLVLLVNYIVCSLKADYKLTPTYQDYTKNSLNFMKRLSREKRPVF